MGKDATPASCLSQGEQRALASFIAGRLPAGQLHDELCRAREQALAKAVARPAAAGQGPVAASSPTLNAA
jgi:hypothetical protein